MKISNGILEVYDIMLNRKPNEKILRVEKMQGNWCGLMFCDYSIYVIPPFINEKGTRMTIVPHKVLTGDLCASEVPFYFEPVSEK